MWAVLPLVSLVWPRPSRCQPSSSGTRWPLSKADNLYPFILGLNPRWGSRPPVVVSNTNQSFVHQEQRECSCPIEDLAILDGQR